MIRSALATAMVRDLERAPASYRDRLGLSVIVRYGDEWAEVECPGLKQGLHPARGTVPAGENGGQGGVSLGFAVDDLEAAMTTSQQHGVQFQGPVANNGPLRLAFCTDPDGTPLYLSCENGGSGGRRS